MGIGFRAPSAPDLLPECFQSASTTRRRRLSSGNKSFFQKREKLEEHTGLFLNKWFLKKESWHETGIMERSTSLSKLAVEIWPSLKLKEELIEEEEIL